MGESGPASTNGHSSDSDTAVVARGVEFAEQCIQPEVDPLDEHERPRHGGVLADRAPAVERVAHDCVGVLAGPRHVLVAGDGVVEQRKVFTDVVGVDGRPGLQHSRRLDDLAEQSRIVLHCCCFDHRGKRVEFVASEVLHKAEIEERDRSVVVEQVVARVGVAVEGTHAIQAAEHEPEDHFTGVIALLLRPREQLRPREAVDQLRRQYSFGAVRRNDLGNPDERVSGVVVEEHPLVAGLEFVVDFFREPDLDFVDHLGRVEAPETLLEEDTEEVGVLQVGGDCFVDAGVLHFHGDRAFGASGRIDDDRPMHLPDRGGGDGFGVELDEQLGEGPTQLGLDGRNGEVGRHRRSVRLQLAER